MAKVQDLGATVFYQIHQHWSEKNSSDKAWNGFTSDWDQAEKRNGRFVDGLMQKRRNSNALAMELRLFCIKKKRYLHYLVFIKKILIPGKTLFETTWAQSERKSFIQSKVLFTSCVSTIKKVNGW